MEDSDGEAVSFKPGSPISEDEGSIDREDRSWRNERKIELKDDEDQEEERSVVRRDRLTHRDDVRGHRSSPQGDNLDNISYGYEVVEEEVYPQKGEKEKGRLPRNAHKEHRRTTSMSRDSRERSIGVHFEQTANRNDYYQGGANNYCYDQEYRRGSYGYRSRSRSRDAPRFDRDRSSPSNDGWRSSHNNRGNNRNNIQKEGRYDRSNITQGRIQHTYGNTKQAPVPDDIRIVDDIWTMLKLAGRRHGLDLSNITINNYGKKQVLNNIFSQILGTQYASSDQPYDKGNMNNIELNRWFYGLPDKGNDKLNFYVMAKGLLDGQGARVSSEVLNGTMYTLSEKNLIANFFQKRPGGQDRVCLPLGFGRRWLQNGPYNGSKGIEPGYLSNLSVLKTNAVELNSDIEEILTRLTHVTLHGVVRNKLNSEIKTIGVSSDFTRRVKCAALKLVLQGEKLIVDDASIPTNLDVDAVSTAAMIPGVFIDGRT